MELKDAIDSPRFHHQWYPDEIMIENGSFDKSTRRRLTDMGYTISNVSDFGRVDAIMFLEDGSMVGHSDIRGYGKAVGY